MFLSSKITLFLLFGLTVFLTRQKYIQFRQNQLVEGEKQKIQSQIEALEKKNKEIASSLSYFKSEGFKQRVAREQLNLKQPDEQVFSFREARGAAGAAPAEVPKNVSNPIKWLKFFSGQEY